MSSKGVSQKYSPSQNPLRKPSKPLARPTAVSSPRPPFKWRGSIPASPAFDLPPRIRLVVRPDTGQGVFCFTVSNGRLRPPRLVPWPAHRRLLLGSSSAPSCPTGGQFLLRDASCPPPSPRTPLLTSWEFTLVGRFKNGSVRPTDVRLGKGWF